MSATTEKLLEQITRLESHIRILEANGEDTAQPRQDLLKLQLELNKANHVLTEARVLKG